MAEKKQVTRHNAKGTKVAVSSDLAKKLDARGFQTEAAHAKSQDSDSK